MAGRMTKTNEAKDLKLSDIEQGLRLLWGQAGERWTGAPSAQAIRVCTLNMVVFVSDQSSLDHIQEAVTSASQTQPLRAVLLVADPNATESDTEGNVSGYCRVTDGGNLHICCEQIVLHAKGPAVSELPASTSDLLVPELPVALWWTGKPPFGSDLFERFEGISDYLIIDSREFECTQRNFRDVDGSIKRYPQVGIGDLNWARLIPWREGAAEVFDEEDFQQYLARITALDIEYAGDNGANIAQAMLYAGWFGSRLSWTKPRLVSDHDEIPREFAVSSSVGREICIRVKAVSDSRIESSDVASVTISTDDPSARFCLSRKDDPEHIQVSADAEGARSIHRLLEFEVPSLGELLAEEVEAMGADAIYEEALVFAAGLMAEVEACEARN
jgi:glucose-6-phosphate dehydrogenase assembly protein OpcA